MMKRIFSFILITGLTLSLSAFGQEIYKWVDEKGILHFADDLALVPEKYRDQVQKRKPPAEPSPSPSPPAEKSKPAAEPSSARRDSLGRGEEWWRAKAKEWNDKLENAQKNYDEASQALKAKEQQREDSKFKPHSQRKRLTGEEKVLEEKVKEREKELKEIKNMVEKVLPRQAEDYHADPNWLKPKEQQGTSPGAETPPGAGSAPDGPANK